MKPKLLVLLGLYLLVVYPQAPLAAEVKLENLPPVVVATSPRAGSQAVDPGLNQIKVTFNKPMQTKNMWSWVMMDKTSFPQIVGQVHFLADGRTCVAPVKLKPGRTYAVWFNYGKHQGFRDLGGRPAVPYLLGFRTRP